jgi:Ca2+-dependent lipid-binding protein
MCSLNKYVQGCGGKNASTALNYFYLFQAHDLQAQDFSGTADPYAKIRLLPDRSNVWQTRIHKRTLNPGSYA